MSTAKSKKSKKPAKSEDFRKNLPPIKRSFKDKRPIWTFDIETKNWTQFVVAGTYDGKTFKHHESIKEMIDHLLSDFEDKIVYAHNGASFDFRFLLEELYVYSNGEYEVSKCLSGPTGYFKMNVSKVLNHPDGDPIEVTIEFRDSIRLLPFTLRTLCETFKTKTLKGDIEYDKIDKITPELLAYLEDDCKGLWQALDKYSQIPWVKRTGIALTTASQSLKTFQLYLNREIMSLPETADAFVRRAYFGGRTEIFRPYFESKDKWITCVDANSLYPSVMQDGFNFPVALDGPCYSYSKDGLSIWDVEVDVPKDMFIPPLGISLIIDPVTHEVKPGDNKRGKFVFPTGRFRGCWTNHEIEYAKSLGVKVTKYHTGYSFVDGGPIFGKFVADFWNERKKAKKEKNSLMETFTKLMLNSNYGRHGLNADREALEYQDPAQPLPEGPFTPSYEIKMADGRTLQFRNVPQKVNSYSNVAISAFVTSYARVKMHKLYMKYKDHIYYTDTDSIFLDCDIEGSNELGELKYEYKARRACFLLPKVYSLEEIEDLHKGDSKVTYKTVMKGVKETLVKMNKVKIDELYEVLAGEFHLHKKYMMAENMKFVAKDPVISKMKTAMQKGSFLATEENTIKTIQSKYDKREVFMDENGKWTSRPLHIEKGRVINYHGSRLVYADKSQQTPNKRVVKAAHKRPEYEHRSQK